MIKMDEFQSKFTENYSRKQIMKTSCLTEGKQRKISQLWIINNVLKHYFCGSGIHKFILLISIEYKYVYYNSFCLQEVMCKVTEGDSFTFTFWYWMCLLVYEPMFF